MLLDGGEIFFHSDKKRKNAYLSEFKKEHVYI
jgi:hypothetical protein